MMPKHLYVPALNANIPADAEIKPRSDDERYEQRDVPMTIAADNTSNLGPQPSFR